MAKTVIHFLEAVEVAQQHGQRIFCAPHPGQLFFQMLTNRSGVGKPSEKISARGALRFLVLKGIFDRDAEFGTGRQEHPEVFFGEVILFAAVERQNSRNALAPTQWDAECGLQSRYARGFSEMESFCDGIAVDYRLFISRHPTGKPLAQWNPEGGEEVVIYTVDIFRNQHSLLTNEEDNGVVGNHFLQANRYHRKRFLQAQGVSERLGKFKEELSFLARRDN